MTQKKAPGSSKTSFCFIKKAKLFNCVTYSNLSEYNECFQESEMCECSQSPLKTVSKLTFDSEMTKNEIERPQMGGAFLWLARRHFLATPQTCLNAGFAGPLRLRPADAGH